MSGHEAIISTLIAGLLLGGIYALTALGLSLVLGVLKVVNLAHGEFLIVGAYASYYFASRTGLDPLLGLPLVALATALLAAPLYPLLLRPLLPRGPEPPMMTMFGVSILLQNLFLVAFSANTRSIETRYSSAALTLAGLTVPWIYVIGCAIAVVAVLAVHALVASTAFGRDLRASAQDPGAAAILGVNVGRVQMLTFALGAACAAAGGTLLGLAFSFTPASGGTYLLTSFAVVVLGGLGNIRGTLFAGMMLGLLQSLGGVLFGDGYRDAVGLVLFLAVLMLRPQGLLAGRRR